MARSYLAAYFFSVSEQHWAAYAAQCCSETEKKYAAKYDLAIDKMILITLTRQIDFVGTYQV